MCGLEEKNRRGKKREEKRGKGTAQQAHDLLDYCCSSSSQHVSLSLNQHAWALLLIKAQLFLRTSPISASVD